MAWIVPIATAALGAYSSNQQAKAGNKGGSSWTDQQSTQDPYMAQRLNPGINAVLDRQAQTFDMIPQIDRNGNVTYMDPRTGKSDVPLRQDYTQGGTVNWNQGGGTRSADPGQRTLSGQAPTPPAGMTAKQAKQWKAEQERLAATGKGKKKGAGAGAAGGGGANGPATTPQGMFQDIYAQGMKGPSATVQAGDRSIQNILGGSSQAGGGTERTGFEGYNPILDFQANQLMGENATGSNLLAQFLGAEGGRYGGDGGGGSGGRGGRGSSSGYTRGANGALQGGPASGGVPDTMQGSGWFQDHTNEMWGEGPDPELQTLIDAYAADAQRAGYRTQAGAQAAAAGAGRLGGGAYNASMRQVAEDTTRDIGTQSAQIRVGDRQKRQDIRQNLLGMVNQRDLGAMNDATQREGIASSERASGASSAAASESARRGQDLQGILGMMSYDTDQRRLLSGIGSELSGNRVSALGLIPGQEDARYAGIDRALGAAGAYGSYDASKHNANVAANAQRSIANQQMGMQAGMFNAQQQQGSIDNYLRTLGMVGGMGGSSHTWGQNAVPGAGVSVGGATAAGALGGALAGWGAYNQYKG